MFPHANKRPVPYGGGLVHHTKVGIVQTDRIGGRLKYAFPWGTVSPKATDEEIPFMHRADFCIGGRTLLKIQKRNPIESGFFNSDYSFE